MKNEIKRKLLDIAQFLAEREESELNFTIGEKTKRFHCRYTISSQNVTCPPMFISTLPKSGSIYMLSTLRQTLNLELKNYTSGEFPFSYINYKNIKEWKQPGNINLEHISADPINLRLINFYCERMVLHVRDPRQAVLSWVHFLPTMYRKEKESLFARMSLPLPKDYFTWEFSERLDWYIKHHFQYWVEWIQKWVDADQDPSFQTKILFTTYQDLVKNPLEMFQKIVKFYDISEHYFENAELPKNERGKFHYRKGLINEWVDVFTDEQKEITESLIPESLKNKFGWL